MLTGGGYLPKILNAIVDAIPEGGGGLEPLLVDGVLDLQDLENVTLSVSEEDLEKISLAYSSGRVILINVPGDGYSFYVSGFDSAHYYCLGYIGVNDITRLTIVAA